MRVIPVCGWNGALAVVQPDKDRKEVSLDVKALAAGRLWLKPKAAQLLRRQLSDALREIGEVV